MRLSMERARAVMSVLVKDGLNPEYVKCKGYGGTKPRGKVPDLNRRVEITVLNDEFGIDLSDSDDDEDAPVLKDIGSGSGQVRIGLVPCAVDD